MKSQHTVACSLPLNNQLFHRRLLLQFGFNDTDYFNRIRLCLRTEATGDRAILADNELFKVPFHVIFAFGIGLQKLVQRRCFPRSHPLCSSSEM